MKSQKPTLIFVYNTDGNLFSSLKDAVHKITSPEKYTCNLCAITYGPFYMKKEWKSFIENIPLQTQFFHRDEFRKKYPQNREALPSVFIKHNKKPILLISKKEMNKCKTLKDLKLLVGSKTKNFR